MALDNNIPMTQQDLLKRIHIDREMLAKLWEGLTEEQVVQRPSPQEDWSVKDLIAHISWWENFIISRVRELINGKKSEPVEYHDLINARTYQCYKDSSFAEILAAFDANWLRLEALINTLTDKQINTPAYYQTYDGVALLPILAAGTFNHYPSHMSDLHAYVEKLNKPLS
jgi:hypothetical protein